MKKKTKQKFEYYKSKKKKKFKTLFWVSKGKQKHSNLINKQ